MQIQNIKTQKPTIQLKISTPDIKPFKVLKKLFSFFILVDIKFIAAKVQQKIKIKNFLDFLIAEVGYLHTSGDKNYFFSYARVE